MGIRQDNFSKVYLKLINQNNLETSEAETLTKEIVSGRVDPHKIAALLTALSIKGESYKEIYGFVKILNKQAIKIKKQFKFPVLDTCGTGGDNKNTFNISTISALVLATAGAKVSKHGNRSVTSRCGSADLLESLGVKIDLSPERIGQCLEEIGIAFLFAPLYHPVMKYVMPIRKSLGFKTIFNILGPLLNPIKTDYQLMGVYHPKYCQPIAKALFQLGLKQGLVVNGMDGIDEVSIGSKSKIVEFNQTGKIKTTWLDPQNLGFKKYSLKEISSKTISESKKIALSIINGKGKGAKMDIVILNSSLAYWIYQQKKISLQHSIKIIKEVIQSGKVKKTLEKLIHFSNQ